MKRSSRNRPIRYAKGNAGQLTREPETLALLNILALGRRQIAEGRTIPFAEALQRLRARLVRNP